MDYIIYTAEGFTQSPKGDDIENCQIVDFQYNSKLTKQECIQKFLDEHSTDEVGLNKHELAVAASLNDEICNSIEELIIYMQNYICQTKDRNIENHLNKLAKYLNL